MKNFTLMLFMLLLSSFGYSQLPNEGFENTWISLTGTSGLAGPAGWAIINNLGPVYTWEQGNGGGTQPAYEGSHSAYLFGENVATNTTSDDWLITPAFAMPANAQLKFYSRLFINADQGTQYKVMITDATGTLAQQLDMPAYDELQSWTELQLNPTQQQWQEQIIAIDASTYPPGTMVHIAFVMMGDNGDRWAIDNVSVLPQCQDPSNLIAQNIGLNSASLSWDTPTGGATSWEIEFLPDAEAFTGTGIVYSNALPYVKTGLAQDTEYKYRVRALCNGNSSQWIGPYNFTTARAGDSCATPYIVNGLPFTVTDNTANFENNYTGTSGSGCNTASWETYLDGMDVIYTYTPATTGLISINATNITDDYAGMFIYTSCENIGVSCYAADKNDFFDTSDLDITQLSVTAGTTYYIVLSSSYSDSYGYTLNIQQENCNKPTALTSTGSTANGATLNWTEAGTASSWQYVYQPAGTGLPMGAGTTANTTSATLTGLPPSTQYEFYVRANCGDGTFSSWAGPVVFNTLCEAFTVPYFEGFNANTTSQFCWTVANINGPESTWNMDFSDETFEGDQAAQMDVSLNGEDNNDMLITPAILLTGNQRLKFNYKTDDYGAISFRVVLSTTGTAPEDFTTELFPLTAYANTNFIQKVVSLADIPAGPVHIAWQVPGGINAGYQLIIDNIIIEDLPACAEPTELNVTNVTATTASFGWTPGSTEIAWEVFIADPNTGVIPDNTTLGTPATNPYTATGLVASTQYSYYVRSVCSTNGNSTWVGPLFFTTGCDAFNVPFFEGFNSDSATQQCWTIKNADGDWAEWNMEDGDPFEGDEAAIINMGNTPNNDWLISPAINLTGTQRLKYHYKVDNPTDGTTGFTVLLSTGQTDIPDFIQTLVPAAAYTNTDYKKQVVSLSGYTGTVHIAWQVPPAYDYGSELMLDNIVIEEIPLCPEPLDVVISNILQTSAQISWTAGGNETAWEVLVYADGQEVPTTGLPAATNSITVTNLPDGSPLQAGTVYHVVVKAVCNDTNSSVTSDVANFVTQISNDDCNTATVIPVNTGAACEVYASGTLNGATASPQENPCGDWTFADDDVWFKFTATNPLHTLSIIDISDNGGSEGNNTFLMFIVYEGDDCGNLTQMGDCMGAYQEYGLDSSTAVLNNLTVGNTYTVRVFSPLENTNQTSTFNVCVKIPVKPISVSTTLYTVEELVTNVLFGESCTQISNITWSTGTNFPDPDNIFGDNPNGIGYFNQNGSSFPLSQGIVMTTGDVTKVPGPNYTGMEQGSAVWLGDTDIDAVMENMLGAPPFQPSTNASVIEFDFVPSVPTLNFDFLFASEEYGDFIQCFSYDTFAMLLTDENGNTQNIAVIPGTDDAISVYNISGAGYPGYCPGYNLDWFAQYNVFGQQDYSPTSFAGQTVVMTATTNVQVNHQYHLKIAIAETDNNLDSGVFIKGGSNAIANLNLGNDLLVATNTALCADGQTTLQTGLDDATWDFEWTRDNVVIEGATTPNLVITQPGTYTVNASLTGTSCVLSDSIVIEFYPSVATTTANPVNLIACDADGFATFDLSQNTATILAGLNTADYTVSYHLTQEEAAANTGALTTSYQNATQFEQIIYVRIVNNLTQCYTVKTFKLIVQNLTPDFTLTGSLSLCQGTAGTLQVTAVNFDPATVTYSWTLNTVPFAGTTGTISITNAGTYTVTINNSGCTATKSVTVTVSPVPVADILPNVAVCDSYTLPALSANNAYYTGPEATGTLLNTGTVIIDSQTVYIHAQVGDNANCTSESSFAIVIIPTPDIDLAQNCNDNNQYELSIIFLDDIYSADNAGFAWTGPATGNTATLIVTAPGTYHVTVTPTDNTICPAEASIVVDDTSCDIQRGISPNNDGMNDSFDLTALGVKKLEIFNRYGQEVYGKTNYTNEWHGQADGGNDLPTGTYFYVVERTNGETKTGWVYINRQVN